MEKPNSVSYISPEDSDSFEQGRHHKFEVIVDGKQIAAAEVNYYSKPIPLYQVTDLFVDHEHKGEGYASQIMAQIESFLRDRGKPGVLVDAIMAGDPASGMYEKRGWVEIPDSHGRYVYNWPENVSLDKLDGYAFRYTDHITGEENRQNGKHA